MVKYKIEYDMIGGAGAPIIFSSGSKIISMDNYSKLMKLYDILGKEEYNYMSKIKDLIYRYNTKISDFNSRYIINVSTKELKVIEYIIKKFLKKNLY